MIFWILTAYFFLFLLMQLLIFFLLLLNKDHLDDNPVRPAKASVLLAARNEAEHILFCLESIDQNRFSKELLEVWVGDDCSEDQTREVVGEFIREKTAFHLLDCCEKEGCKAKVLAKLCESASGEYFLFTDADVKVNPQWVQALVKSHQQGYDFVAACTFVEGKDYFAFLQKLEWASALGQIKAAAVLNIPVTAAGNNMSVTRKMYQESGGFEKINTAINEDYALFRRCISRRASFAVLLHPLARAGTLPVKTFFDLLQQRKRWMRGAFSLPFYLKSILVAQAMFFPLMIYFLLLHPFFAFIGWAIKFILQTATLLLIFRRVCLPVPLNRLFCFIGFEFYHPLVSFISLIFYILPFKIQWKGRIYA